MQEEAIMAKIDFAKKVTEKVMEVRVREALAEALSEWNTKVLPKLNSPDCPKSKTEWLIKKMKEILESTGSRTVNNCKRQAPCSIPGGG
jgi:hypothetical protein